MNFQELSHIAKEEIINKFTTINNFCKATKRSLPLFNNFLRASDTESNRQLMNMIISEVRAIKIENNKPNKSLGNKIRNEILKDYKSLREFCLKNPEFTYKLVDDLVHARPKKISIKGSLLIKKLNLEI